MFIMLNFRNHITFLANENEEKRSWLVGPLAMYQNLFEPASTWCNMLSTSNYPVASWSHVSEESPTKTSRKPGASMLAGCHMLIVHYFETPRNWDAGVPCAQKGKSGIVHSLLLLAFHPATPRNLDHLISEVVRLVVVAGWYQYVYRILLQGSRACTNSSCDDFESSIW